MPFVDGDRVRHLRIELRLTQDELAGDCMVSKRTIQLIERDPHHQVKPRTLDHLIIALRSTSDELVRRDPPPIFDTEGRPLTSSEDHLLAWPSSLFGFVRRAVTPDRRCFCEDMDDARVAVAEMRRGWGEHLNRFADARKGDRLFDADRRLNKDYPGYERRYLDIWRANPRSILFSTLGDTRTGLSFVLPVRDEAYEAMRGGRRHFMEITADDILPESQNLILDSLVELPDAPKISWYQVTSSLSFTLFFQLAVLSIDPVSPSFRMLGFGASPMNARRLESVAFRKVGTRMPAFDFPLYEFGIDLSGRDDDAATRVMTSTYLAKLLRTNLEGRSDGFKAMVIRRALAAFRPIAKRHGSATDRRDAA